MHHALVFKGSTQVSEGLTVFYKTEFQVDVDGDGDVFKQRNIFAGIKGQFWLYY